LLACIGGLDRTGGRPDGGPARVGAAQRNCVVAGGTKAGGDRSRAGGGIDDQRHYPGRASRADLEMPVVITGQTHFSTTRPVGLIEQGCGVGGAGLVELELVAASFMGKKRGGRSNGEAIAAVGTGVDAKARQG